MEKNKVGKRDSECGKREKVTVFNRAVRGGIIDKLEFEQRLERGEGVSLTDTWDSNGQPEVGACLACWKSSQGTWEDGEAEK